MNIYDREAALYNIQEIIVNKIKSYKQNNINEFTKEMKPLFNEREQILLGNEEIINKYKNHKEI